MLVSHPRGEAQGRGITHDPRPLTTFLEAGGWGRPEQPRGGWYNGRGSGLVGSMEPVEGRTSWV